jgi:hypothetical protein
MVYSELFRDALLEIGALDPLDDVPAELQELARVRYNGIINQRNARSEWTYAVTWPTYTTTSGLSIHTIGPDTATWSATLRPVEILGANLQIGSGVSLINVGPINLRDRQWWLANAVPQVQSGVPTDLYYEPTFPNGSIYLWPVPNAAYVIQLELRTILSEIDDTQFSDDFSLPPSYRRDLTLTLAEDLCGPLTLPMPPSLMRKAATARADTQSNNNPPVRIQTRNSGMPGGSTTAGGGFNWVTGKGGGR